MTADLLKTELNIKTVVTIVLFVAGGVVGFYKTVILPINAIQEQLSQIQTALQNNQIAFNQLETQANDFNNRITRLENFNKIK